MSDPELSNSELPSGGKGWYKRVKEGVGDVWDEKKKEYDKSVKRLNDRLLDDRQDISKKPLESDDSDKGFRPVETVPEESVPEGSFEAVDYVDARPRGESAERSYRVPLMVQKLLRASEKLSVAEGEVGLKDAYDLFAEVSDYLTRPDVVDHPVVVEKDGAVYEISFDRSPESLEVKKTVGGKVDVLAFDIDGGGWFYEGEALWLDAKIKLTMNGRTVGYLSFVFDEDDARGEPDSNYRSRNSKLVVDKLREFMNLHRDNNSDRRKPVDLDEVRAF